MKEVSNRPTTETITPFRTLQKNTGVYGDYNQPRHRLKVLSLAGSLILLIIGGGWLLHYLSKNPLQMEEAIDTRLPAKTKAEEKTVPRPEEPAPPTEDPARLMVDKQNAEQKLTAYLAAKSQLDNKGASEWGGQAYAEMTQLGHQADRHFMNKQYSAAAEKYDLATILAGQLAGRSDEALSRIENLNKEKQFQQLMSEGLAAFHRNDYALARARLLKAKILKPQSPEVADALLQVDQAIRLAGIDTLRAAARAAERSEDWQKALKSYLAVLSIDKNVQFAARGKERALDQIRIQKRIQFFLTKPDALESDSQLKNAVHLLKEAKGLKPQGANLTIRIKELEALVNIAQTQVKIILESDNLTDVAVYRVGKLGRFSVRELRLRPGTYTVVGNRDGYQDVRQKIVVKPGRQALRITVKCRVKI